MFVWCSYCQRLLCEKPPYDNHTMSYGLCAKCSARASSEGELFPDADQPRVQYFRDVQQAARRGQVETASEFVATGLDLGIAAADIAVGMLHPILHELGDDWEAGRITLLEEHRGTRWCENVLAHLPRANGRSASATIAGRLAPGNSHTVGIRIAEYVLGERGIVADIDLVPRTKSELAEHLLALPVELVAISCALADHAEAAVETMREVRSHDPRKRGLLVGPAIRTHSGAFAEDGVQECASLWDILHVLGEEPARE